MYGIVAGHEVSTGRPRAGFSTGPRRWWHEVPPLLGTSVCMNPTPGSSDPSTPSEPSGARPPARTLTASTPEDVAAFVPLALGFVPQRSVVMISVGTVGLHARVDLPHDPDDVDDVVEALLRPARRHRVQSVLFVVYDDDTTVADEAVWALHEAFEDVGITVKEALRVHDDHWFAVLPGAPLQAYRGVRFQLSDHPFTAQGVFDGRVTHASRDALRDTLAHDPVAGARLRDHLGTAAGLPPGGLAELVQRHLAATTTFTDPELAAVAATVVSGTRRDEAWAWLDRRQGAGAVALWSDAVRRLPDAHVGAPAAILAFAAWLAGDGALAWCAVDRCRAVQPGHPLAALVAGVLEAATSPATWETMRPRVDGITDPAA